VNKDFYKGMSQYLQEMSDENILRN